MSKKALWILVSVLVLALVGGGTAFGINQWKAAQVEKEAEANAKKRAEMDAGIAKAEQSRLDRDNAFATAIKTKIVSLTGRDSKALSEWGQGMCAAIANGSTPQDVAVSITEDPKFNFNIPYASMAVSESISTYCPEQGPMSMEQIDTLVREEQESKKLAEQERITQIRLKTSDLDKYYKNAAEQLNIFAKKGKKWTIDHGFKTCAAIDDGESIQSLIESFEEEHGASRPDALGAVVLPIYDICWDYEPLIQKWSEEWN